MAHSDARAAAVEGARHATRRASMRMRGCGGVVGRTDRISAFDVVTSLNFHSEFSERRNLGEAFSGFFRIFPNFS
jgi:hypothetical protein